jgi:hypothetical protein
MGFLGAPVRRHNKANLNAQAHGAKRMKNESLPPDPSGKETSRPPLIDRSVVQNEFTSITFADSHGAFDSHLGAGLLYYALAQMVRAQVTVCIGSGGGFVPKLLRRAQLDAHISPSRTYLVDANLPDLGFGSPVQAGGWLTPESDFQSDERDIVVLNMLSSDAARVFAAQRLSIDYLHIDGDHSRPGVLADFRAYAPLMSRHGVITMHDLRMPGVTDALRTIEAEFPQWDILTFADIGAGTAAVRRRLPITIPRRPQYRSKFVDKKRRVDLDPATVKTATASSQERARFERWQYLTTEAYRLRYRLALAELDRPGATLLEIGGYPNSVADLVEHAATVHLVEPYAPAEYVDRLRQRSTQKGVGFFLHPATLADLEIDFDSLGAFHLIALGLDLSGANDDAESLECSIKVLIRLLSKAQSSALELPGYKPSLILWNFLESLLAPRRRLDVTLDLSKDPVADEYFVKDQRALRRLMVIDGVRSVDIDAPEICAAVWEVSAKILAVQKKQASPVDPIYRIGEEVVFAQGGNGEIYKRTGWVAPEKNHSWSLGHESLLVLSIDPETVAAHQDFRLTIKLKPFVVAKQHETQRLSVLVNGEEVLHESELRKPVDLTIAVPRAVLLRQHPLRIKFEHPDFRSPASLIADSRDTKELAFAFSRLTLSALPAGTAQASPSRDPAPPGA